MRFVRPRFTLRWLMLGVAIFAIGAAIARWMRSMDALSTVYQQRAVFHISQIAVDQGETLRLPPDPRAAEVFERRKAYRQAMRDKWNHAALFPWLSFEPDPPVPN